MRMVNLTAHAVSVVVGDRVVARWEPSGVEARVREQVTQAADLGTDQGLVARWLTRYDAAVDGLPGPAPGTAYLVSRVLAAVCQRADLYFPWGEVRDGEGRIIGCRGLAQFEVEGGHA